MRKVFEDEKDLTACETLIMKAIWDEKKDVPFMELQKILKERFDKDYSRTTVATFLLKLSEKGFVKSYRVGRISYVCAIKSEEEYKQRKLQEETRFWFSGNTPELISTLFKANDITKKDIEKIREILDGVDKLAD